MLVVDNENQEVFGNRVNRIRDAFAHTDVDTQNAIFALAPREQTRKSTNIVDFSDWEQFSQWPQSQ